MKKRELKKILAITILTITMSSLAGCGNADKNANTGSTMESSVSGNESASEDSASVSDSDAAESAEALITDEQEFDLTGGFHCKLTSYDLDDSYDTATDTLIQLNGTSVDIAGDGIQVSNNQIVIQSAGTYIIAGTLSDGQIVVNAGDDDKVHIVLQGADLTSSNSAPISILNADKVILTLADQTDNSLTDGYAYTDDSIKGCLFSKCDLTINGSGSLTVNGNYNNGISGKDDVKIVSGSITVDAAKNGIKGNDSVAIYGGRLTVTAKGDGIKSDNEDSDKGFIYLQGGTINISADDDCLQAVNGVIVDPACFVYGRCVGKTVNCDGTVSGEENIREWL